MSPKRISRPLDIYVRVSDVKGRSGESFISPQEQERRCREIARQRGFEVGAVLTDLDLSGSKMHRPALNEALERIRLGTSGGIIVAKLDRFSRTLIGGVQTLEQINELGGAVIVADGDLDTSTATGELFLHMLLSFARFELRRIKDNWQSAKRSAVERGIHIAPRVPAGYRRDEQTKILEPDGKNAKTIRDAYTMAARGDSYARISTFLNNRELPTWSGEGVWQPNRIKRLLENRVYLGEARSGNGHKNPNAHEPLVGEQTWTLAQRRSGVPSVTHKSETLLASLCRCASCSFAMRSQQARGKTIATYRCSTTSIYGRCPAPTSISLERLEQYVIDQFLERASVGLRQTNEPAEDEEELVHAAIEAEHMYRDALTNVELRQRIGAADHDAMIASLHQAWQDALAKVPTPSANGSGLDSADLSRLLEQLRRERNVDGLRELLGSAIQAVFVRPAASRQRNLPVSDRVKIVWRDEPSLELPKRGTRFEPRSFAW